MRKNAFILVVLCSLIYLFTPPALAQRLGSNDGFLVMINGVKCLKADDFGDNIDELYIEVYIDGQYYTKLGPKTMKPLKGSLQNTWESLFDKKTQSFAKWLFAARQEYWMMPGSFYAKKSVRFELWEADSGKKDALDADDHIGSVTINQSEPDGQEKASYFNKGGESGHWKIVCTKKTRTDYSTVAADRKTNQITIPIKDQGNERACVGFATTAALAMAYQKQRGLGSTNEDLFDGSALYAKRHSTFSEGWKYAREQYGSLNYLLKHPFPFKSDPNVKVQLKNYYVYKKDGEVIQYFLKNGQVVSKQIEGSDPDKNGLNKMRAQLKNGHALLTRYDVYPDFNLYVDYNGVYAGRIDEKDEKKGGHAVLVYGYENPQKGAHAFPTWLIQNSWGPDWGNNGKLTFASGTVGIDEEMYKIGDIEIVQAAANTAKLKQLYFRNTSNWVVKYDITYKEKGSLKNWQTGELHNDQSKRLQVYDNWQIVSIKAQYKDVFTWRNVGSKTYNKPAKHVSAYHYINGAVGAKPTIETQKTTSNKSTNKSTASKSKKLKQLYFKNNSDWDVKYEVIYKEYERTKTWQTGELRKSSNKRLQVYDNWQIIAVKAQYKDLFTWRNVGSKTYNKPARNVSANHYINGRIGSKPKMAIDPNTQNKPTAKPKSKPSNKPVASTPPKLKQLYFKNNSAWDVKYDVVYKEKGKTKTWRTGDLRKGGNKRLQVYDNWQIINVKAQYKDVFTWRNVGSKSYNKQAKNVPANHIIKGNIGSKPKLGH